MSTFNKINKSVMEGAWEVFKYKHIRVLKSLLPEAEKLLEDESLIGKDMWKEIWQHTEKLKNAKVDRKLPDDKEIGILLGRALVCIQKYKIADYKNLEEKRSKLGSDDRARNEISHKQDWLIHDLIRTKTWAEASGCTVLDKTTEIIDRNKFPWAAASE